MTRNRWSAAGAASPRSRLLAPDQSAVVAARDQSDRLLTTPSSLGILDRAVDRAVALGHADLTTGTMVIAVGRHPVVRLGVSAYRETVGEDVLSAARAGRAMGAVAAKAAGLRLDVVDAGSSTGNLRDQDPMTTSQVSALLEDGAARGRLLARAGLVAVGEIGVGNTTVAAALAAGVLSLAAQDVIGLGAGADSDMVQRKVEVVSAALRRWRGADGGSTSPESRLAALGGPEFAFLTGVILGAALVGAVIVLDGLATGVAAMLAVQLEPAVAAHLVAGQRSRERAHPAVLQQLGLEPLLDLRLRAGEGVGAAMGAQLLFSGLAIRRLTAQTDPASASY